MGLFFALLSNSKLIVIILLYVLHLMDKHCNFIKILKRETSSQINKFRKLIYLKDSEASTQKNRISS